MIAPHEFKPLGNWCLIRRIDQHQSSRVVIVGDSFRRNLIAALIAHGPAFAGARVNDTVMLNWTWGTEDDIHLFPDGVHMIVSGERIRALVTGIGHRRRIVPIGDQYLVRQLTEIQPNNIILPAQFRQSLDFEIVRRGTKCTQDIEPGTRGRIFQWDQRHIQVETDEGACILIPTNDILYIRQ